MRMGVRQTGGVNKNNTHTHTDKMDGEKKCVFVVGEPSHGGAKPDS